jgi:hypothetical protein
MPSERELIQAIHDDRLAQVDDPAARAVCRAIGERVGAEVEQALTRLTEAGIEARPVDDPTTAVQRHSATLAVTDGAAALAAARVLAIAGYLPWDPVDGPAGTVRRFLRSDLTLARTSDVTMAITLRWPPSRTATVVPDALVPNANDFDAIGLPAVFWPLYIVVRPIRLLLQRLGVRKPSNRTLGPFLSTPDALIEPLLKLADIGADDVVVDLGCGDGRILRTAVETYGCRAIGVESDPALVEEARKQAASFPAGRIRIEEGDAIESVGTLTTEGTVYFVFVPADAAATLIATLLRSAQPGATVIAHEQHRLAHPGAAHPGAAHPDAESFPMLTDQGVTVAHRWRAG